MLNLKRNPQRTNGKDGELQLDVGGKSWFNIG